MEINPDATVKDSALWDIRSLVWDRDSGSAASDGAYMKSNILIDGIKYYLKLSNYNIAHGIFGHESVNEIVAERLGRILGFNVPEGQLRECLVTIEGIEYSSHVYMSNTFKQANITRISFEDFYRSYRYERETPLELCKRYGWENCIFKMFIFDYLIINRDRHGGNLEVLKSTKGFELSPLFDNGLSFLCANTDPATVPSFDVMLDRPVNNFIGERSLDKNLQYIDRKLRFAELRLEHQEALFKDLYSTLPPIYFEKIWETITRRWERVKEFCVA